MINENELNTFIDDKEKMYDFFRMKKEDFLKSYSYLTEKEYELTKIQTNIMSHKEVLERYGSPVSPVDTPELIGQIINILEDFLDEKGIIIDNPERHEDPNLNPEDTANIYGSDYGELQDTIHDTLADWKILEKR